MRGRIQFLCLWLVGALALTGCVHQTLHLGEVELERVRNDVLTNGKARVTNEEGTTTCLRASEEVGTREAWLPDRGYR